MFVALAPIANMKHSVALKPIVTVMNTLWELTIKAHVWEIFAQRIKDEAVNIAKSPILSWTHII